MYRHLILDLDGTVYLEGVPIRNIIDILNQLKRKGVRVSVLTNNTSFSLEQYLSKVQHLGLPVDECDIFSPITVAGKVLTEKYGPSPRVMMLGTEGMVGQLEKEFGFRQTDMDPQFVLVGFDKTMTYAKLQKACEHVNAGLPYYITHIDLACPSMRGPVPDCGALGEVIRMTTGVPYTDHFGKPGEWMASEIRQRLSDPEKTLLAGDRLYTDIRLGHQIGVHTLLVLTGETTSETLDKWDGPLPTHVAESLPEFLECHFTIR